MSSFSYKAAMASSMRARGNKLFSVRRQLSQAYAARRPSGVWSCGCFGQPLLPRVSKWNDFWPWYACCHWHCWAVQGGEQLRMIWYSLERTRYDPLEKDRGMGWARTPSLTRFMLLEKMCLGDGRRHLIRKLHVFIYVLQTTLYYILFLNDINLFTKIVWHLCVTNFENCIV